MQISKEDVLVSVAGGPKLNDGKWHTVSPAQPEIFQLHRGSHRCIIIFFLMAYLMQPFKRGMLFVFLTQPKLEVSNHGKFVILEVDGSAGLVVGMQSKQMEEAIHGKLRLALGGILINKDKMIVQVLSVYSPCNTLTLFEIIYPSWSVIFISLYHFI